MDSLLVLGLVMLMVAVNALFVAAEFAPIAAPRTTIDTLAAGGNRLARMLQPILHDAGRMDRYVATVQLGITLTTIGLGMYGEHAMASGLVDLWATWGIEAPALAHGLASLVAVAAMTYLHVVVGEMVPKSVALATPVRVALWVMPVMRAVQLVLWPLVWLVESTSGLGLRLLGVNRDAAHVSRFYTSHDLHDVVASSELGGALTEASGQVFRDLLEFSERTAEEVMVPRVAIVGLPVGCDRDELAAILARSRHTRHPIYHGDLDHIVGGIHVKKAWREHLLTGKPIAADSGRSIPFVPEQTPVERVLEVMRENGVHMVVVMDEHGGTAGLITVEDLFEEVVGEIEEVDSEPSIESLADGSLRVRGTVRLDELAEELQRELDHDEADTVSGLVLLLLGRPAKVADTVEFEGLRFTVTTVAGHGVKACTVRRIDVHR